MIVMWAVSLMTTIWLVQPLNCALASNGNSALGQSKCVEHLNYLLNIYSGQQAVPSGEVWPWRMLDAAGRFPMDGFLSNNVLSVPGSESGCLESKGSYPNGDGVERVGSRLCTFSVFKGERVNPIFGPEPKMPQHGQTLDDFMGLTLSVPLLEQLLGQARQAVCVPESCSIEQVEAVITHVMRSLPGQNESELQWNAATVGCSNGGLHQLSAADILMIAVSAFFVAMCILGTVFSYAKARISGETGLLGELMLGFSVPDNISKLFAPERRSSSHISCLNGIRVISMLWIVYGHTIIFGLFIVYIDGLQEPFEYLPSLPFRFVTNAFPSVDNFFFMSGLLVGYLTFKELDKREGQFNILMFYLHRYLRLIGLYAYVVGMYATALGFFERGHVSLIRLDHQKCASYWWQNVLFIQNLFRRTDICLDVSWYLDNDMQMFLVSPLLLLPMHRLAKKSQGHLSILMALGWMVVFTVFIAILSYINEWPISIATAERGPQARDFQTNYYIQAYCRCLPYIMGITIGFVLNRLQGKEVKIPSSVVTILWLLTTVILSTSVFGLDTGGMAFSGATPPDLLVNIYFNSVGKLVYGAALGWLVFACVKGYGGFLNTFLSWEGFTLLGRLSFSIFLVHQAVIDIISSTIGFQTSFSVAFTVILFIGVVNCCIVLALLLSIFLEMPYLRAEKTLFNYLEAK